MPEVERFHEQDTLYSRRDILKKAAIGAAFLGSGIGLTACNTAENTPPSYQEYVDEEPKLENPVFRAASALVLTEGGSFGHGGVYTFEGNFYLMTQWHVVRDAPTPNFHVMIPGLRDPFWNIQAQWGALPQSAGVADPNVLAPLTGAIGQEVYEAVVNNEITPLTALAPDSLVKGQRAALPTPNRNEYSFLTYKGVDKDTNLLAFEDLGRDICQGLSGIPVLQMDDQEQLLPYSYGLLTEIEVSALYGSKRCSNDVVLVQPHL